MGGLVGKLIITKADMYWPGALCRVVSETAKRAKVEVLNSGRTYSSRGAHVQGGYRGETPYVDKSDIWKVITDADQYARYLDACKRRDETIRAVTKTAQAAYEQEIAEIFGGGDEAQG